MVYIRSFVLKFQQQIGIQYGQNISISQLFSMLHELRIRNFAIIDQLELTFAAGLNILTGETGAGKSIILDALGMLLGNRAGAEWIRAGTELAEIEGVRHALSYPIRDRKPNNTTPKSSKNRDWTTPTTPTGFR